MWKRIGLGVAALAVVLVGAGFILPAKTHVEKSILISAPQDQIFTTLNNIKEFNAWSPWIKMEPGATTEYSGPESGEGASLHWAGKKLGKGSMTVIAAAPETRIDLAIEFAGKAGDRSWFDLSPQSGGIQVTWGYESTPYGMNLFNRYSGALLAGPMIRKAYKSGLNDFKTYVENKASLPASSVPSSPGALSLATPTDHMGAVPDTFSGELVTLEAKPIVLAPGDATGEGIDPAIKAGYDKISAYIAAQKLTQAGAPVAITHSYDVTTAHWVFDAGIPLSAAPATPPAATDGVTLAQTYAGKAVKFKYHGDPSKTAAFYNAIDAWLKAQNLEVAGDSWEEYLSDAKTPITDWDVNIYFPVK
jgi:effector-binding domain-containing protein